MDDLAEQICDLMVEYVKGLRDDFVGFNFWSEIRETGMTEKRVMPLFFFFFFLFATANRTFT